MMPPTATTLTAGSVLVDETGCGGTLSWTAETMGLVAILFLPKSRIWKHLYKIWLWIG